jgi:PAS domain S-box-containing protein
VDDASRGKPSMKAIHKSVASIAGAALLVALVVAASFWAFEQMKAAAVARKHTYEVIGRANGLLSALKDAETGERGYALTGDKSFLEPYLAVRDRVGGQLAELRRLALIGAASKQLDAIAPLMDAKMAELSQVIELRRTNDMTAVLAVVAGGRGRGLMDSIRVEMSSFIQMESDALAQHEAEFQSNMRHLFAIIVTASLLTLLFVLLFAYLIHRETQHQLKHVVHLKTRHLLEVQEETNKQLQQANVTLQVSEEKLAVTLNSIGDGVIATDAEGHVIFLNPVAEQLTGWTQAEAVNRPVDEIFHIINQETRQPSAIPVKATLAHGTVQGLANGTVLVARGGSEHIIADSCAPIHDRDDKVIGAVLVFRDVSKEYATQQAVRDGGALVRTILNTVVDGIITLHAGSGIVETVNPAAERMFGYSAAELIGKNFSLLIPELDQGQHNGSLEHYNASDEARAVGLGREVMGRRKDGSVFPLEIAVSEMWLGGKRFFTGILRDTTARKRAEEELLKAGPLQNAIFNSANFSSIATDAKGVIQIFNVGAERMLGYAAADVMNKITPADISDPQEVIARAKALSVELSTPITPGFEALVFKASRGIEDIYELTYIRKDGSRFPAVVSVTALRDAQNTIIGYLLIGTDNSARKQVEAEQKKLDQRFRDQQFYTRSLIESNIDALMMADPLGIITDANKQMEALTGCTRDELIGAPFKNYFTDPERAEAGIKLALIEKKVSNYELTARARDGKETVVSYNATTLYDRDRKLQGVFAAARDVTERNRLDQVLKEKNVELEGAKSAAEKANLAKSDFLSSMSHELRSPLNAILGFAQLMESADPLPTASQAESIAQILQAGWHLLNLINEILDLAVIESGKVSLSNESVSVAEVMSECHAMMEPQAQQRGIRMTFPRFDNPVFVWADRTRLKQIIINLVSNAIKYNKERGTVIVDCTMSAPPSSDSGAAGPERIRISVADTGAGLPPEKLAQLFHPFNRLGQETGGVAGTGIGLVVTRRLAELMEGLLGVESTVGVGSVFWCELKSAAAPQLKIQSNEVETPVQPQWPAGAPRRTLLYVEDNPANMMLVEQLIARRPDMRLLTAVNGTLGIGLAQTDRPQVILMDVNLPGISGIEALKILRADPVTAHIPIVALSANAMPRDIATGLKLGFFRYLTKPIKVNEFMDTLNAALEFAEKTTGEAPCAEKMP